MLRWSVYVYIVACAAAESTPNKTLIDINVLKIFGTPKPSHAISPNQVYLNEKNGGGLNCVRRKDGKNGICVRSYLCDPATGGITQTIVIDPRFGGGECNNFKDVCCLPEGSNLTPPTVPPQEKKIPCGYSNPGAISYNNPFTNTFRIKQHGDSNTLTSDYSEFPWTIALLRAEDLSNIKDRYIGGGSLIHPRVVLTAASKVVEFEPTDIICRAGEWDLLDLEQYPHVDKEVEHIIWHEGFFYAQHLNNVALLILKSSVIINEDTPHLAIACLGKRLPPPGTVCQAMGWGKKNFNDREIYAILKKMSVPLVGRGLCEEALRRTRLGPQYHLRDTFLCAGGVAGMDPCSGDGGAPLVCNIEEAGGPRYAVYGIVSWGIGCGEDNVPGVYMKVPSYVGWIKDQMALHQLDTTYFEYQK